MPHNELRKDYLLNRWVVIATERARRPIDFAKDERKQARTTTCPMCPGNEHMTPPAVLVYLGKGKRIRKTKDKNGKTRKNWLIRAIPNLYPAFNPPENELDQNQNTKTARAIGHHEVIVESQDHNENPADARTQQLVYVINAYIDRLRELAAKPYVQFVSIFRNHGLEAGASLSHAHSQIIATPIMPTIVQEEIDASKQFWTRHKQCIFCDIIKKERKGPRVIFENSEHLAFTPYASVNPMEFWIAPKEHEQTPLNLSPIEIRSLAETMKKCLHGLKTLVNDPPYNYGFHLSIDRKTSRYYHWHLEVYPKLSTWAGFEKSTGMYINTITPETAAESLRIAISS